MLGGWSALISGKYHEMAWNFEHYLSVFIYLRKDAGLFPLCYNYLEYSRCFDVIENEYHFGLTWMKLFSMLSMNSVYLLTSTACIDAPHWMQAFLFVLPIDGKWYHPLKTSGLASSSIFLRNKPHTYFDRRLHRSLRWHAKSHNRSERCGPKANGIWFVYWPATFLRISSYWPFHHEVTIAS